MNVDPHISLIFVNYQSAQRLGEALESLFFHERATDLFEVIVVNNDVSEGPAIKKIKEAYSFILIESEGNYGFGYGCNKGAKQARGKMLGFINPDTLWRQPCLLAIEALFRKRQEIGVVGMALMDAHGNPESWSAGAEPSLTSLFLNNINPQRKIPRYMHSLSFPDWVSGCGMFTRADLFSRLDGFDEHFFLYFEDVDLCKRAREQGLLVARTADSPLTHFGAQSRLPFAQRKQYFYESQKKYFSKHRSFWEIKALKTLHWLFSLSR